MIGCCFCHTTRLFFFSGPHLEGEKKFFSLLSFLKKVFFVIGGRRGKGKVGGGRGELRLVLLSIEREGRRRERM